MSRNYKKRRIFEDHPLTQTEKNRRHQDKIHSIDVQMKEMFDNIDWDRRKEAETDIVKWVNTYCLGVFLEDPPPPRGEEVLRQMWNALDSHNNYMILMGRGSGKSVYELCTTVASISMGIQKFIVIVSNNTRASTNLLNDIWRMISNPHSPYAQDYPEMCGPYLLCNGSFRIRQLFNGQSTELSKTSQEICFPRLVKEDGTEYPTSGSVVTCRGLNSGIRGLRKGTQRVTCVLLDDLQDKDIATSPEQVQKVLDSIKKDIIPLAGKERLSIIQTATPICQGDLVEQIQQDKTWQTTLYPAIISYPKNKALWDEYFTIYDGELTKENVSHQSSLNFYKEHFDEMNEGVEVFNPSRFSQKDGHISMIQKLLELEHNLGSAAFQAEYQMNPPKEQFQIRLTPSLLANRTNKFKECEIPQGYDYITFGVDINPSYAISIVGIAWNKNTTGIVFYKHKHRLKLDQKLPDTRYNALVETELGKAMSKIKALGIKVSGVAIDCGGRQWDAVNLFAKNNTTKDFPICAFAGRSSPQFDTYAFSRGRLKDPMGRTVLCGDKEEQAQPGNGFRYVFFDADFYKHQVIRGFNSMVGDVGSLSIYDPGKETDHQQFYMEMCNEQLKSITERENGQKIYSWLTKEPHDYIDSAAMCRAVLSQLGITNSLAHSKNTMDTKKQKFLNRLRELRRLSPT